MTIKKLDPKESKSKQAIVETLRGYLDMAFDEELTFLEVKVKTATGQTREVSIVASPKSQVLHQ